ncbi:alpha/beta hydrolase [Flavobacterium crassostreae]|uniref:Esterase n=1 Tax=Flavobacterium crassostreae TaxID=1763534 RepID=A0A1B9DXL1_9FLAO|nr:alpha/beta hydrolase-fold protein [Flavobacterium crassostreae]OCB74420.1 esterase [Flavobacterium crassostreae]
MKSNHTSLSRKIQKTISLFVLALILLNCANKPAKLDPIPKHTTFTIHSQECKETRVINVWTPETYSTSQDSLNVIYMADGGIKEDFPHIANTLAQLIETKQIPPTLLVGIENTQRRRDLTGFTEVEKDKEIAPIVGGSAKFRAFIANELFPEINQRYRTTVKKTLIGESLSGLFVLETFFMNPEMFDNYIAFDPSLWWNKHYLITTANQHLLPSYKSQKKVWFTSSKAKDISLYTTQLATILEAQNNSNIKWNYTYNPQETHATIFRATKEKALIWTLKQE